MPIKPLSQQFIDKVRTGVTLGSVARAVAELLANSIDAQSKNIVVKLASPELSFTVEDDGHGVDAEDLDLLGTRYCTSKMRSIADLQSGVKTLGFRGEAVSSIVSDSGQVVVTTRAKGRFETWTKQFGPGGREVQTGPSVSQLTCSGTIICVERFLFAQPVRHRAMVAQHREIEAATIQAVLRQALPFVGVGVTLIRATSGQVLLHLPRGRELFAIFSCLAPEQPPALPLTRLEGQRGYSVSGVLGGLAAAYPHQHHQYLYVNRRHAICTQLSGLLNAHFLHAHQRAGLRGAQPGLQLGANAAGTGHVASGEGKGCIGSRSYPAFLLDVECPAADYDVTSEPDKSLVIFKRLDAVQGLLRGLAEQAWGPGPRSGCSVIANSDGGNSAYATLQGQGLTQPAALEAQVRRPSEAQQNVQATASAAGRPKPTANSTAPTAGGDTRGGQDEACYPFANAHRKGPDSLDLLFASQAAPSAGQAPPERPAFPRVSQPLQSLLRLQATGSFPGLAESRPMSLAALAPSALEETGSPPVRRPEIPTLIIPAEVDHSGQQAFAVSNDVDPVATEPLDGSDGCDHAFMGYSTVDWGALGESTRGADVGAYDPSQDPSAQDDVIGVRHKQHAQPELEAALPNVLVDGPYQHMHDHRLTSLGYCFADEGFGGDTSPGRLDIVSGRCRFVPAPEAPTPAASQHLARAPAAASPLPDISPGLDTVLDGDCPWHHQPAVDRASAGSEREGGMVLPDFTAPACFEHTGYFGAAKELSPGNSSERLEPGVDVSPVGPFQKWPTPMSTSSAGESNEAPWPGPDSCFTISPLWREQLLCAQRITTKQYGLYDRGLLEVAGVDTARGHALNAGSMRAMAWPLDDIEAEDTPNAEPELARDALWDLHGRADGGRLAGLTLARTVQDDDCMDGVPLWLGGGSPDRPESEGYRPALHFEAVPDWCNYHVKEADEEEPEVEATPADDRVLHRGTFGDLGQQTGDGSGGSSTLAGHHRRSFLRRSSAGGLDAFLGELWDSPDEGVAAALLLRRSARGGSGRAADQSCAAVDTTPVPASGSMDTGPPTASAESLPVEPKADPPLAASADGTPQTAAPVLESGTGTANTTTQMQQRPERLQKQKQPIMVGVALTPGSNGIGTGESVEREDTDGDSLSPLARFLSFAHVGSDPGGISPPCILVDVRQADPIVLSAERARQALAHPPSAGKTAGLREPGLVRAAQPAAQGTTALGVAFPQPAQTVSSASVPSGNSTASAALTPLRNINAGAFPAGVAAGPTRNGPVSSFPTSSGVTAATGVMPASRRCLHSPTRLVQSAPPHAKKRVTRVHGNATFSLEASRLARKEGLAGKDKTFDLCTMLGGSTLQGDASAPKPNRTEPGSSGVCPVPLTGCDFITASAIGKDDDVQLDNTKGQGLVLKSPAALHPPAEARAPLCLFFRPGRSVVTTGEPALLRDKRSGTLATKDATPQDPVQGTPEVTPTHAGCGAQLATGTGNKERAADRGYHRWTPAGGESCGGNAPSGILKRTSWEGHPRTAKRVRFQLEASGGDKNEEADRRAAGAAHDQDKQQRDRAAPAAGRPVSRHPNVHSNQSGNVLHVITVPGESVQTDFAAASELTSPTSPKFGPGAASAMQLHPLGGAARCLTEIDGAVEASRPCAGPGGPRVGTYSIPAHQSFALLHMPPALNGVTDTELAQRDRYTYEPPKGPEAVLQTISDGQFQDRALLCMDRDLLRLTAPGEALIPVDVSRFTLQKLATKVMLQVDRKFIPVLSSDGTLLVLDQHAAHERVRLETLTAQLRAAIGGLNTVVASTPSGGINAPNRETGAAATEDTAAADSGSTLGSWLQGRSGDHKAELLASLHLAAPVTLHLTTQEATVLDQHALLVSAWGWRLWTRGADGTAARSYSGNPGNSVHAGSSSRGLTLVANGGIIAAHVNEGIQRLVSPAAFTGKRDLKVHSPGSDAAGVLPAALVAGEEGRRELTSVPVVCGTPLANGADLRAYLHQLQETGGADLLPPAVLRVLRSKACRSAIMFGDELNSGQCADLLTQLRGTKLWMQCAHGRPTVAPLVKLPVLQAVLKRRRASMLLGLGKAPAGEKDGNEAGAKKLSAAGLRAALKKR